MEDISCPLCKNTCDLHGRTPHVLCVKGDWCCKSCLSGVERECPICGSALVESPALEESIKTLIEKLDLSVTRETQIPLAYLSIDLDQECAGQGNSADVYVCSLMGTKTAAKVFRTSKEEHIKKFHLETQFMQVIDSPSIIDYYGFTRLKSGKPCILMEWADSSLKDKITPLGYFLPGFNKWCVDVANRLASGLIVLHQHNILHRDIKPENVMFVNGNPKWTDFGLATVIEDTIGPSKTQEGLLGTIKYAPPEFFEKKRRGPFSDVYSFSLLLYELFTCEFLYPNMETLEIMNLIVREKKKPELNDPLDRVPKPLLNLLREAVNCEEPSKRPSMQTIKRVLGTLSDELSRQEKEKAKKKKEEEEKERKEKEEKEKEEKEKEEKEKEEKEKEEKEKAKEEKDLPEARDESKRQVTSTVVLPDAIDDGVPTTSSELSTKLHEADGDTAQIIPLIINGLKQSVSTIDTSILKIVVDAIKNLHVDVNTKVGSQLIAQGVLRLMVQVDNKFRDENDLLVSIYELFVSLSKCHGYKTISSQLSFMERPADVKNISVLLASLQLLDAEKEVVSREKMWMHSMVEKLENIPSKLEKYPHLAVAEFKDVLDEVIANKDLVDLADILAGSVRKIVQGHELMLLQHGLLDMIGRILENYSDRANVVAACVIALNSCLFENVEGVERYRKVFMEDTFPKLMKIFVDAPASENTRTFFIMLSSTTFIKSLPAAEADLLINSVLMKMNMPSAKKETVGYCLTTIANCFCGAGASSELNFEACLHQVSRAMRMYPEDEDIQDSGCIALANMVGKGKIDQESKQEKAALKEKEKQLGADESVSLGYSFIGDVSNGDIMLAQGVDSIIVKALRNHFESSELVAHALLAVSNLCAIDAGMSRFSALGVPKLVVEAFRKYEKSVEVSTRVSSCIAKLCKSGTACGNDNAEIVAESGVIPEIPPRMLSMKQYHTSIAGGLACIITLAERGGIARKQIPNEPLADILRFVLEHFRFATIIQPHIDQVIRILAYSGCNIVDVIQEYKYIEIWLNNVLERGASDRKNSWRQLITLLRFPKARAVLRENSEKVLSVLRKWYPEMKEEELAKFKMEE